jgi:hypothetical protein
MAYLLFNDFFGYFKSRQVKGGLPLNLPVEEERYGFLGAC